MRNPPTRRSLLAPSQPLYTGEPLTDILYRGSPSKPHPKRLNWLPEKMRRGRLRLERRPLRSLTRIRPSPAWRAARRGAGRLCVEERAPSHARDRPQQHHADPGTVPARLVAGRDSCLYAARGQVTVGVLGEQVEGNGGRVSLARAGLDGRLASRVLVEAGAAGDREGEGVSGFYSAEVDIARFED